MKRGILVATLIMTAAGVASAKLLADDSRAVSPPMAATRSASPAAEPAAPVAPVRAPVVQEPTKASQKASVEARQAPVPLQMKPRATLNAKLPTIDALLAAQSPEAKDADEATVEPASAAADDGFSEAKAKAAIEADGYKGVTALRKGQGGIWHAKALRGKTEVMLTVDASGSVAAD